jgi:hypothetical protein
LRAQSLIAPDGVTLAATALLFAMAAGAVLFIIVSPGRRPTRRPA